MPRRGAGRVGKGNKNSTRSTNKTGATTSAKIPQVVVEEARQRNLLAPVSRLPPELVLHIFAYVKATVTLESKYNYGINGVQGRDWIKLTHVFRLWRDIALCAPSLWTDIHISKYNYRWANEMLRRSQQIPLAVHVNFLGFTRRTRKYKEIDTALSTLEASVGRCRVLSLYNVQAEAFARFFPPNHNASQLHTLRLSSDYLYASGRDKNALVLSDRTLLADALRHLTLIAFELDWTSSFLRRLTHLKISSCPFDSSDVQSFLRVLPEMTSLELLDLDDTIEFAKVPGSKTLIPIPTLKVLRIDASMENVAALLSILEPPSTVNLLLSTFLEEEEDNGIVHYLEILLALGNLFTLPSSSTSIPPPDSQTHIKSYRIIRSQESTCDIRIQAFRSFLPQNEMLFTSNVTPPSIDCTFEFEFEMDPMQEFVLVRPLLDILPLEHVESAQIVGELLFGSATVWAEKFGGIKGLRSMLVGEDVVPYMFTALTLRDDSENVLEGGSRTLLFPALDTIFIHGYTPYTMFLNRYENSPLGDIATEFERRRAFGSPIRQVVFIDCDLDRNDHEMHRLRQVVEHVEELELDLDFGEIADNAMVDTDSELDDENEACFD